MYPAEGNGTLTACELAIALLQVLVVGVLVANLMPGIQHTRAPNKYHRSSWAVNVGQHGAPHFWPIVCTIWMLIIAFHQSVAHLLLLLLPAGNTVALQLWAIFGASK
jgi:hypothetical protein